MGARQRVTEGGEDEGRKWVSELWKEKEVGGRRNEKTRETDDNGGNGGRRNGCRGVMRRGNEGTRVGKIVGGVEGKGSGGMGAENGNT